MSVSSTTPTPSQGRRSEQPDPNFVHFPKSVLIGAAVLLSLTCAFAFVARNSDIGAHRLHPAPAVASVDLQFLTLADGAIEIRDVQRNNDIKTLPAKSDGFIKIVLRSVMQERTSRGIDPAAAFRLSQLTDGQTILKAMATGRIITVGAFGSGNRAVFAELLGARDNPGRSK